MRPRFMEEMNIFQQSLDVGVYITVFIVSL